MSKRSKFLVRQKLAQSRFLPQGCMCFCYLYDYWWGIGDVMKTRWTCSENEAFRFHTLKAAIRFCIDFKKAENVRLEIVRVKEE